MSHHTFKVTTPIDGSVYTERPYATATDIDNALNLAASAQTTWRDTALKTRIALCQKALEYLQQYSAEISEEITCWRKNSIFKPNQQKTGKIALFGCWNCRWTNRVASAKFYPTAPN